MTQLALAFPPASPFVDDHAPTFMAENTTTLLAIAAQALDAHPCEAPYHTAPTSDPGATSPHRTRDPTSGPPAIVPPPHPRHRTRTT